MHPIPKDLDLKPMLGQFTTQLRVGQFDLQFSFGGVSFAILSPVAIFQGASFIGGWENGTWPGSVFYDIMNIEVVSYKIVGNRQIIIDLKNGLSIHLEDDNDYYETIDIWLKDGPHYQF